MTVWTHFRRLYCVLLSIFIVSTRKSVFVFACQVHKSSCVWYKKYYYCSGYNIQLCLGGSFEYDHCGVSPLRWKWQTGFFALVNFVITHRNNILFLGEIIARCRGYIAYIKIKITHGFICLTVPIISWTPTVSQANLNDELDKERKPNLANQTGHLCTHNEMCITHGVVEHLEQCSRMIEEVHQVCYKVTFRSYFDKTKRKRTFFADSYVDWNNRLSQSCINVWSSFLQRWIHNTNTALGKSVDNRRNCQRKTYAFLLVLQK